MAINIMTAAFKGVEGIMVSVELDISRGLPTFNIVGLADVSVKESKERVRAAIINSGFEFPVNRITVNLAPADLKKEGSQFDLPIAIGLLVATGQINIDIKSLNEFMIMGELSLSGDLKKVKGALPIVIEGIRNNIFKFLVPVNNRKECCIVENANIYPFENLKEVVSYLENRDLLPYKNNESICESSNINLDFEEVVGQESCKRAIEVAAAGGHNVIMFGPPGSGKTMIAQRIPTILPKLNYNEALEVTQIYSVSGNLDKNGELMLERPFRNPHHTSSSVSLVGGGRNLTPGEASLAHNGVLFLDEILEFKKTALEVLRQPLEDRVIKISRVNGTVEYPANFILAAALNPCPCGYYGSNIKPCICSEHDRSKYIHKLSGPLLDRIDIFTFVNSLSYKELIDNRKNESSKSIRKRVENARSFQKKRFEKENIYCNAEMNQKQINMYCKLDNKSSKLIEKVYDKYRLSNRAYSRILKVSRTISDLKGKENIEDIDVIEALQYRMAFNNNDI